MLPKDKPSLTSGSLQRARGRHFLMQYFSKGLTILRIISIIIIIFIIIIEIMCLYLELYNDNNNIFFDVLNVVLLFKLNSKKNTKFCLFSWILTRYIGLSFIYLLFSKRFLTCNTCSRSIFRSNGPFLEIAERLLILQNDHLVRDVVEIKGSDRLWKRSCHKCSACFHVAKYPLTQTYKNA